MVDPSLNINGCVIVCELSICLYVDKNGRDLKKGSKCDGRWDEAMNGSSNEQSSNEIDYKLLLENNNWMYSNRSENKIRKR